MFAHPGDDTYGVAGSLALHAASTLDVTVILTTSGDAGLIADPSLATRERLGAVREAEDRASWEALGLRPEIHLLRHRDGSVAELAPETLVAGYLSILQDARPDVVVTFGPDGVTANADHVAVGAAATAAFHAARAAGAEGFERLLHVGIPRSSLDRFDELLRQRGSDPVAETEGSGPRGVPDETIGVRVDCSSVFDHKVEALRAHRTQAELEDVPFELWREMLAEEAFVIAFPERRPGSPVLGDVFEGLPGS